MAGYDAMRGGPVQPLREPQMSETELELWMDKHSFDMTGGSPMGSIYVVKREDVEKLLGELNTRADQPRPAVPEGYSLVPAGILDRFPEINPSNYDHDDACELNSWGVELVLAAQQPAGVKESLITDSDPRGQMEGA